MTTLAKCSSAAIEFAIEFISKKECLWDMKNKDYANNFVKQQIYDDLDNELMDNGYFLQA